jgi:hypothetical protein
MSSNSSAFLGRRRIILDTRSAPTPEAELQHSRSKSTDGLIDLFTLVQVLGVPIIPITWESARGPLGRGGSGLVNQALLNLQTGLAFKRVSQDQKQKLKDTKGESERRLALTNIFYTLMNEVGTLGYYQLREHRHIAELQGIYWEFTADDQVLPVLLFEKSPLGDLWTFLRSSTGRNLRLTPRINLCVDVGVAIVDLNSLSKRM